jgi:hypothetical protein
VRGHGRGRVGGSKADQVLEGDFPLVLVGPILWGADC